MKCHSIDRGAPKRYRVVCKYKYCALNTPEAVPKPRILTPKKYDERPGAPVNMDVPRKGGGGRGGGSSSNNASIEDL